MTYPMEPVLVRKPPEVLLSRLRVLFGDGRPATDDDRHRDPVPYRRAVRRAVLARFGIPTPVALHELIDEAGRLDADPEELAKFIGRQFRLKVMRRQANSSS